MTYCIVSSKIEYVPLGFFCSCQPTILAYLGRLESIVFTDGIFLICLAFFLSLESIKKSRRHNPLFGDRYDFHNRLAMFETPGADADFGTLLGHGNRATIGRDIHFVFHIKPLSFLPLYNALPVPFGKIFFVRFSRGKRGDIFCAHILSVAFCVTAVAFCVAFLAEILQCVAFCVTLYVVCLKKRQYKIWYWHAVCPAIRRKSLSDKHLRQNRPRKIVVSPYAARVYGWLAVIIC